MRWAPYKVAPRGRIIVIAREQKRGRQAPRSTRRRPMTTDQPREGAPRRPVQELEDNHYHDEDEVAPPPDDGPPHAGGPPKAARGARKLPPRPRRFEED